jgi:hypothetical protein
MTLPLFALAPWVTGQQTRLSLYCNNGQRAKATTQHDRSMKLLMSLPLLQLIWRHNIQHFGIQHIGIQKDGLNCDTRLSKSAKQHSAYVEIFLR